MAGETKPEYEKMPVSPTVNSDPVDYEKYYTDIANESTLEPTNKFATAQRITNGTLSTFATLLGSIPNGTWAATPICYMITVPMAVTVHAVNPNLDVYERGIMIGWELYVAAGGILLAACLSSSPVAAAVLIPIGYTLTTSLALGAIQKSYESN